MNGFMDRYGINSKPSTYMNIAGKAEHTQLQNNIIEIVNYCDI
jgi:hypothetical protein